jgi:cytochrome c-type protein NapC
MRGDANDNNEPEDKVSRVHRADRVSSGPAQIARVRTSMAANNGSSDKAPRLADPEQSTPPDGGGSPTSVQTSSRPRSAAGRLKFIVLALVFFAGIVFAGTFNAGLSHTNRMEFCISCHTMQTNYNEYKDTLHYKNQSGVQATCADCHVPKEFVPKMIAKVVAAKDVYHEILGTIDTPEKFEAHRWDMASRVWKKMRNSNSRECRSCHDLANMDLSEQSRSARSRHAKAEEKGQTCIDCHAGVAHTEPDEPREEKPNRSAKAAAPAGAHHPREGNG